MNSCDVVNLADECRLECSPIWESLGYSPALDSALAALLILCAVFGAPANLLSLKHFLKRLSTNADLPTLLYISICCIDICTCLVHLPVSLSLLSDRDPLLFSLPLFCLVWETVFTYLQKVSMFLVMFLSVTRCVAIALPLTFQNVNRKRFLVLAFPVYSLFLVGHDVLVLSQAGVASVYGPDTAYCYIWYDMREGDHLPCSSKKWVGIDRYLDAAQVGVPSVVSFVSFLVCTCILRSGSASHERASPSSSQNERAAVTVTMFTGLFLICNLPLLLSLAFLSVDLSSLVDGYPGPLFSNSFMYWYSWPIAKVLFTVLNAALNPLLYFYRIPGARTWFRRGDKWAGYTAVRKLDNARNEVAASLY